MNNKWSNLDIKEKIAIASAILAFILGWGLSICGFWIPPVGDVADSVLWILGQALIYAASVFGVASYFTTEAARLRSDVYGRIARLSNEPKNNEDEE